MMYIFIFIFFLITVNIWVWSIYSHEALATQPGDAQVDSDLKNLTLGGIESRPCAFPQSPEFALTIRHVRLKRKEN